MIQAQCYIGALIKKHFPNFMWSSLMLNKLSVSMKHQDLGNTGSSVAIIITPPDFPKDQGLLVYAGDTEEESVVIAGPNEMAEFNGLLAHETTWYQPDQVCYSIIAFTHKTWQRAKQEHAGLLQNLG